MCIKNAHWGQKEYKMWEESEIERKESTKSVTIVAVVKPKLLDQSNSSLAKAPVIRSIEQASSPKIRLLCSFHMVHIKHKGTKFYTSDACFPNQFCQPNNKSTTLPSSIHWILNDRNIKLQIVDATRQCSNRCIENRVCTCCIRFFFIEKCTSACKRLLEILFELEIHRDGFL